MNFYQQKTGKTPYSDLAVPPSGKQGPYSRSNAEYGAFFFSRFRSRLC